MGQTWNPELPTDLRPALKKVKLIADDEQGLDWDQWDGYPAERDALLGHINDNDMENVVILSGDVHVSLTLDLHRDPFHSTDAPIAVEIVTPSLTSQNLDDKMGWPCRDEQSLAAAAEYWHLDTVLERTPNEERASVWAVEHGTSTLQRID